MKKMLLHENGVVLNNDGEFDPGSERTLAARLKHASRTAREKLASLLEWRTGEEHVGNLPIGWG